jgi:hypothetical protein
VTAWRTKTASAIVATLAMGCGGSSLNGAKGVAPDYPPQAGAPYGIDYCLDNHNAPSPGPDAVYQAIDQNRALLERSRSETTGEPVNTLVTNHWSAPDGDHYFYWSNGTGWELVLGNGGGKRLVYFGVDVEHDTSGSMRPRGDPALRCDMIPTRGRS